MAYLLPFILLFGFLSAGARHGDDVIVVPLVLLVFCLCGLVPFVREEKTMRCMTLGFLYVVGLIAFAERVRFRTIAFSDSYGVHIFGVPLVLLVIFVTLVCAATIIASRRITHPFLTVLASAMLATICALVIEPAAFGFGLTAYFGNGMYYGVPISMLFSWFVAACVGAIVTRIMLGKALSTLPLSTVWGALLLIAYFTGIAVGFGMWGPAILGLLVIQLGFRAIHFS